MTVRTYSSPQAFKEALERRLRSASKNGVDFARRRQLLVFDRFLARIVAVLRDTVLLKGGLVLELRLDRARTTKDIDLRLTGSPETVLADLTPAPHTPGCSSAAHGHNPNTSKTGAGILDSTPPETISLTDRIRNTWAYRPQHPLRLLSQRRAPPCHAKRKTETAKRKIGDDSSRKNARTMSSRTAITPGSTR